MMILLLFACDIGKDPSGNNNTQGGSQEQSTDPGNSGKDNTESYDLTSIEGYLGQFGLTEDFLKLPAFTRFSASRNIATQEVSGIGIYQSEIMSAEQKQAYAKAVNDALIAVSDDGKIHSNPNVKEYTLDVDYDKAGTLLFDGVITVNGKKLIFHSRYLTP